MDKVKIIFISCLIIFFHLTEHWGSKLIGQDAKTDRKIYTTVRLTNEPPKINGVLDDSCWSEGEWAGGFIQISPYEGNPPGQNTSFKILYDNKYLYVAMHCHDTEPEKIEIRKAPRDRYSGDVAGIAFDSYFDHRTAFEFDLTAAGGKMDLVHQNIGKFDRNWDAVWDGKTAIEDSAWTAEIRIPLSQLRYPEKDEQIWGFHVFRIIYRTGEIDHYNIIPMDAPLLVPLFGELHGISGLEKSRRIELLPYFVGKLKTFRRDENNPYTQSGKRFGYSIGLDGKIGLSTNITLDFTGNPDFGQVEADPSVMNLTAFEVFYDEKRPFFLEGTSILTYDLGKDKVFYTRRIGQAPRGDPEIGIGEYASIPDQTTILSAMKVTGKTQKGLSIGAVESMTVNEKAEISDGYNSRERIVEPFTNYLVTRVQQDFNNGNTVVGGIFTSTNRALSQPYLNGFWRSAYSGGIDFVNYWKDQTYYFDFKTIFSQINGSNESITNLLLSPVHYYQRPDAGYLLMDTTVNIVTGHGGKIEVGRGGNGRLRFSEEFNWRSPGLELNDVGFLKMSDILDQKSRVGYDVIDPNKLFLKYSIYLEQENAWNFGGEHLYSSLGAEYSSRFHSYWSITAGIKRTSNKLDMRILRGGPSFKLSGQWEFLVGFTSDTRKKLSVNLNAQHQSTSDKSWSLSVEPAMDYRISSAFQLNLNGYYYTNLNNYQYVTTVNVGENKYYLMGCLDQQTLGITLRLDYYVTPDLSIRFYGSPFISTGIYTGFREVISPKADNFNDRCYVFTDEEIRYDTYEREYNVDHNNDGLFDYNFNNPDFNFMQFRSNFVARWEFKPGSNIYLVWTHDRTGLENKSNPGIGTSFSNLFRIYPDNIFLVKFNYWFSL